MCKITKIAVICEYNLFHRGHLRQIEKIRDEFSGNCVVISIMSGSFVQRGEPAILPKYERAAAAVMCGADLVAELPYPWSCSSAEYFALAGVSAASRLGCDYLCFGSESGDADCLIKTAENTLSDEFRERLRGLREKTENNGVSDIRLRGRAYDELFGRSLPVSANDILGVEYLRAITGGGYKIKPLVIKREGKESATLSRRLYLAGNMDELLKTVPEKAWEFYKSHSPNPPDMHGKIMLYKLAELCDSPELEKYEGAGGGLGRRISAAAARAASFDEFTSLCASKSYTNAKIRRTALNCVLGVTAEDLQKEPGFTFLLAANSRGREYLHAVKKSGEKFNIITKPADFDGGGDSEIQNQVSLARRADSLYFISSGRAASDIIKYSPYME